MFTIKLAISGRVAHTCHPSTREAETRGKRIQAHPKLHREPSASLCNLVRYYITLIKRLSAKPQLLFFIAISLLDSSDLKHSSWRKEGLRLRVLIKCTRCIHPSPRLYKKWIVAERDRLSHKLPGRWAENSSKGPVAGAFKAVQLLDSHLPFWEQHWQIEWAPRPGLGAIIFLVYFQGPIKDEKTFFMNTRERS